ncbi:MAG: hypothetical protein HY044_00845 [Candidatus Woesebacteria bacterium]|nr:MAG: hypothetical protein HY044_00845 [Candidatus Woesebacteria bacterium]
MYNQNINKRFLVYLLFLGVLIVFFVKGVYFLDPDFGWHLRNGEIFSKSGIFYTDPYSYTMSSFPVVSHEWFSEILIFLIYKNFNFVGLSLVFTLVFFLSIVFLFFVFLKDYKKGILKKFFLFYFGVFILVSSIFLDFFSIRPQVLGWGIWSIFICVLLNERIFKRYKFFLPLIVLVWANIHGSFAVGIASMFIVFGVRFLRSKKIDWSYVLIFSVSFLFTFISPFEGGLWREVFNTFSSRILRANIGEWRSIFFSFNLSVLAFLALSIIFVFRYRKKFSLEEIVLFFLLLGQSITSVKNIPIWIVFSLIIIFKSFHFFELELPKDRGLSSRLKKSGLVFLVFAFVLFLLNVYLNLGNKFILNEDTFYPRDAVLFLKAYESKGNIFSEYGYGGYLIWKLPLKKVFIDGRMAIWSFNPNPNETKNAFDDYLKVVSGETDFEKVFEKYNIDIVLWPKNEIGGASLTFKMDKFLCKYVNFDSCKILRQKDFTSRLKDAGWREVYSDRVSVIYNRPNGKRSNWRN